MSVDRFQSARPSATGENPGGHLAGAPTDSPGYRHPAKALKSGALNTAEYYRLLKIAISRVTQKSEGPRIRGALFSLDNTDSKIDQKCALAGAVRTGWVTTHQPDVTNL